MRCTVHQPTLVFKSSICKLSLSTLFDLNTTMSEESSTFEVFCLDEDFFFDLEIKQPVLQIYSLF